MRSALACAIISSSCGHVFCVGSFFALAFLDVFDVFNFCALVIFGKCCGLDFLLRMFGAVLVISFIVLSREFWSRCV